MPPSVGSWSKTAHEEEGSVWSTGHVCVGLCLVGGEPGVRVGEYWEWSSTEPGMRPRSQGSIQSSWVRGEELQWAYLLPWLIWPEGTQGVAVDVEMKQWWGGGEDVCDSLRRGWKQEAIAGGLLQRDWIWRSWGSYKELLLALPLPWPECGTSIHP